MDCDLCSKPCTDSYPALCTGCARNSVYMVRLEAIKVLLAKEQLGSQIEEIISPKTKPSTSSSNAQSLWHAEVAKAQLGDSQERIARIHSYTRTLREEITTIQTDITELKKRIKARSTALNSIKTAVSQRQARAKATTVEIRDKGKSSSQVLNNRSVSTRAFLCCEAATLLRLKRKKRMKDGFVHEQFQIAGLPLSDLREINNMRCADLSAVLGSVSHLLVVVSFYLGVRLPAEITNPHRDYPLPTINRPTDSYRGLKINFPGSGSITTSSPASSKQDPKYSHRPRPLFIGSDDREERVAQFTRRDPTAFSYFVEGVSLLAWNLAWLNRSQGYTTGTNSWEDVCDLGQNLWQLIFTPAQSPALQRVQSSRDAQKQRHRHSGPAMSAATGTSGSNSPHSEPERMGRLGQASHLSGHSFLGHATAAVSGEQLRPWKCNKYNTISDPLKRHLLTELNNAEWELLREDEWDDGGEGFDEAVMVGGQRHRHHPSGENAEKQGPSGKPVAAVTGPTERAQEQDREREHEHQHQHEPQISAPATGSNTGDEAENKKPRGTSGWTKLKSRNES